METKIQDISGDTWRAAAAEAYKRAGVCIVDKDLDAAVAYQRNAVVYERNAALADIRPHVVRPAPSKD
jgi:hypothetical protein